MSSLPPAHAGRECFIRPWKFPSAALIICEQAKLDGAITPVAWDGIIPALNTNRSMLSCLKGKVIRVQISTVYEDYAKKHFSDAAQIKVYQAQDEAQADLASGRIG